MFLADKISDVALSRAEAWLEQQEQTVTLPLYLSTDIRDAGFKAMPIDANLFPAGFNNLHLDDHPFAALVIKNALMSRKADIRRVLVIMEEHSRNLWYLENIAVLRDLILAGKIEVDVTTPTDLSDVTYTDGKATLLTARGKSLEVRQITYCQNDAYDLGILNNDLMNGIPDSLRNLPFPICPSPRLGWHSRLKSSHFSYYNRIAADLANLMEIDPWEITGAASRVADVDINLDSDREIIAQSAAILLEQIEQKYRERNINAKPFGFLKADYGTYGMGLIPFESPDDIRFMNRKTRNRLFKGKGSREIHAYLLQEGIPNTLKYNGYTAEVCVYQSDRHPIGQFLRYNTEKSERENLNSTGMHFLPFSARQSPISARHLRFYYILTKTAMLAASHEAQAAAITGCGRHELSLSY